MNRRGPRADMREGLIHSIQRDVEIDEREPGAAPTHPRRPSRPEVESDDKCAAEIDALWRAVKKLARAKVGV